MLVLKYVNKYIFLNQLASEQEFVVSNNVCGLMIQIRIVYEFKACSLMVKI